MVRDRTNWRWREVWSDARDMARVHRQRRLGEKTFWRCWYRRQHQGQGLYRAGQHLQARPTSVAMVLGWIRRRVNRTLQPSVLV